MPSSSGSLVTAVRAEAKYRFHKTMFYILQKSSVNRSCTSFTVMNLESIKAGNFLTNQITSDISTKALRHVRMLNKYRQSKRGYSSLEIVPYWQW
jgi:hypothetical protein